MNKRLFLWSGEFVSEDDPLVGVFVQKMGNGALHAGFFSWSAKSGAEVIHLLRANKLSKEKPQSGMLCVLCQIDPLRAEAIIEMAENIYERNRFGGIPFAFSSPEHDWFTAHGTLSTGPHKIGLTCSHFVLAIFKAAALPLVRWETWPERAEDREFQEAVLNRLVESIEEDSPQVKEFINKVQEQIGLRRCRPIELGGAALADEGQLPCEFNKAFELSQHVTLELAKY